MIQLIVLRGESVVAFGLIFYSFLQNILRGLSNVLVFSVNGSKILR